MPAPLHHLLFVGVGNTGRSLMAEAVLNHLSRGTVRAFSAGTAPSTTVPAPTLDTLQLLGIEARALHPKPITEFLGPAAPRLHSVVILSDVAARACPVHWQGDAVAVEWLLDDPATITASASASRRAYRATCLLLKRRIEQLLELPVTRLTSTEWREHLTRIGRID